MGIMETKMEITITGYIGGACKCQDRCTSVAYLLLEAAGRCSFPCVFEGHFLAQQLEQTAKLLVEKL